MDTKLGTPKVRSTVWPDRENQNFNDWVEDMHFERTLETVLENMKYKLKQELLKQYYDDKESAKK